MQAVSFQCAGPNAFHVNTASYFSHHWAFHTPTQAHAMQIQRFMHMKEACDQQRSTINNTFMSFVC
jgi:hypothetical protein